MRRCLRVYTNGLRTLLTRSSFGVFWLGLAIAITDAQPTDSRPPSKTPQSKAPMLLRLGQSANAVAVARIVEFLVWPNEITTSRDQPIRFGLFVSESWERANPSNSSRCRQPNRSARARC
jgi:hypothetical protein